MSTSESPPGPRRRPAARLAGRNGVGPGSVLLVSALAACLLVATLALIRPPAPPPSWALAALAVPELGAEAVDAIADAADVRYAWPLVDRLRFDRQNPVLESALQSLTGVHPPDEQVGWVVFTDHLLQADVPAPPGYLAHKRAIFLSLGDPRWDRFLTAEADLDWREVTWGGVGRDGIVSLDDPEVIPAAEADWLTPADTVFGVEVAGEARAYPRRLLVVHELVNDSLGGQQIALPYCTLCGSAIPYITTDVGDLRTSGLLQRSNKLMYDVGTESLVDQFLGIGLTGPLRGIRLDRLNVTVTTWQAWRDAHPQTTTLQRPPVPDRNLAEDPYRGDFLGGRDAEGPIFAVGERDDRLPPMHDVLGVEAPNGAAVAFAADQAREELQAGRPVLAGGVQLRTESGGLVARPIEGGPVLPSHQAFWFAWSQFRPDTILWDGSNEVR